MKRLTGRTGPAFEMAIDWKRRLLLLFPEIKEDFEHLTDSQLDERDPGTLDLTVIE